MLQLNICKLNYIIILYATFMEYFVNCVVIIKENYIFYGNTLINKLKINITTY